MADDDDDSREDEEAEAEELELSDVEEQEDEDVPVPAAAETGMEVQEVLMGLSSRSEEALSAALGKMRKMLGKDDGGAMLERYVLASPKCIELTNAWAAGTKASTAVPLLLLLSEIFRHPAGLKSKSEAKEHKAALAIQLRIDKLALYIVQNKLSDVYSHLSSEQRSRQNGGLKLIAAIVLRGRLLAKQVASKFDFSLEALRKVAKHPVKAGQEPFSRDVLKMPTRIAFIEFAMAFLLVGDSSLLRWILQKRVLYAGVLHGLARDSSNTVVRVLALMKRKVLQSAGSVPQGIRVALFGDAALEQLTKVTAWTESSEAVDLAQEVLLALCTDPAHGICPADSSWAGLQKRSGQYGGGAGRLLRLMCRLKATELDLHKELLLAIARTRPVLAAAFIDAYPYSLEPRASAKWFSAMLLMSSLINIANTSNLFLHVASPPAKDSPLVQTALRRVWPQKLTRTFFNRCFFQADLLVKHFCLRLLLEVLSALGKLLHFIDMASKSSDPQYRAHWSSLGTFIQDKARTVFPECSTLLLLIQKKNLGEATDAVGTKRKLPATGQGSKSKQRKVDGGVADGIDDEVQERIFELWGQAAQENAGDNVETLLVTKVLEAVTLYQKFLPLALRDINFDAFKYVPDDAESLTASQQEALSDLLLSTTEQPTWSSSSYKNVKVLMKLLVHAQTQITRTRIQLLLYRAFHETGAFESNPQEPMLWLHALPGWESNSRSLQDATLEAFICDVVLNVARNMFKYLEQLHSLLSSFETGDFYEFGPAVICALDSYMRLAAPKAKSLKIPEKAAVSVYLASVLQTLLMFQAHPEALASVIISMLTREGFDLSGCEWNPLKNLWSHAAAILGKIAPSCWTPPAQQKLPGLLDVCEQDGSTSNLTKVLALSRSLYCVPPAELKENFCHLLDVFEVISKGNYSIIISLMGAYPEVLSEADFTQRAALLRTCPFSTLFRALCCQGGNISPSYFEVLTAALSKACSTPVIPGRLLLSRITGLRQADLTTRQKQLGICFVLLQKLVLFSARADVNNGKKLIKDMLSYPPLLRSFLSSDFSVEQASFWARCATADDVKPNIDLTIKFLDPLERHLIEIVMELLSSEDLEPEFLSFIRDSCRPLFAKALDSFVLSFKTSLSSKTELAVTSSLTVVAALCQCSDDDLLVTRVHALSLEIPGAARSHRLVWLYLAAVCLEKAQRSRSRESRDKLTDIYGSILQLEMSSGLSGNVIRTAVEVMAEAGLDFVSLTPLEVLPYCLKNASKTKSEVVYLLVRESPALLSELGRLIAAGEVSPEDLMLFLPASQLLLTRCSDNKEAAAKVSSIYTDVLCKQLRSWEANASSWCAGSKEKTGEEDYKLTTMFYIVEVLRLCFGLDQLSTKTQQRLLRTLLPKGSRTVDSSLESSSERPEFNRILGKLSILRLLFNQIAPEPSAVAASISTLEEFYRKHADLVTTSSTSGLFLENQLLAFVSDVAQRAVGEAPAEETAKWARRLARTILRHRYGEVAAMEALQQVMFKLLSTSEAVETTQKLAAEVIEYVIGHSLFLPLLLSTSRVSAGETGTSLTSVSSALSLLATPKDCEVAGRGIDATEHRRLVLVKLLRMLHAFSSSSRDESATSPKQLFALLLAAYGATLSLVDQEIFRLMHQIEAAGGEAGSWFGEMDYLWGNAAIEKRKDMAKDTDMDAQDELAHESREEIRKRRFKEELGLETRKSAMTVLHFPAERDLWSIEMSSKELLEHPAAECPAAEAYDPAYIIPFASHGLCTGCIEAEEFVRSGLLSIGFLSMSSACERLRERGYQLLGQFTSALEASGSFKGKLQMSTLLVFVRNAITEPWQRIPAVTAVFAAEAAFLLMHPENSLYMPVNRFLLRSPSIDLESVPLFQTMFSSGNVHARSDRTWVLRLLLAGLVSAADARIYRRQFVPEILMSFCTSSMADSTTRKWVLQILKRAVAIPSFAKSLLLNNGVLVWLESSIVHDHRSDPEDRAAASEVAHLLLSKRRIKTSAAQDISKLCLTVQCHL